MAIRSVPGWRGVRCLVALVAAAGLVAPAWAGGDVPAWDASSERLLALGVGVLVALALLRRRMGAGAR